MKKVLITGMSGLIGGALSGRLESAGGYELAALNRSRVEGVHSFQADIADLDAIRPAFEGQDVVVHLSAHLGDDSWEGNLSTNVIGTYNVYEAARLAGVKRVVFGSSGMTIRSWARQEPYKAIAEGRYDDVPKEFPRLTGEQVRPEGIYGAAKVWGEAIGRHFSDAHGLSVLCVRIGRVPKDDRPHDSHERAIWLSHRDVAQMLQRCINASDDLKYDIFMCASNNRWGYRDLDHPRRVLGYVPEDSADDFP